FSTATLAFYVKQRLSLTGVQRAFLPRPGLAGNLLAAAIGAATPFCTCTAVPLFLGMLEFEVPLGPAVSFLLASPTINLGAIVVLLVVFGVRIALVYAAACLLAAVGVGWLIGRLPAERALRDYLWIEDDGVPVRPALGRAARLAGRLMRRLAPWLALATLAGLALDWLVPASAVLQLDRWGIGVGILLAALLGSVIYADILFLIPIGYALTAHGAPVPVVLTFMLAASGLSLPEFVVLSRVLRPRALALFVAATLALYILLGYGFALTGV
ncbi:MAG TPA: permease, partial [Chloroflexota bacterium]|nr:permease [Chloroflexota bacterium]